MQIWRYHRGRWLLARVEDLAEARRHCKGRTYSHESVHGWCRNWLSSWAPCYLNVWGVSSVWATLFPMILTLFSISFWLRYKATSTPQQQRRFVNTSYEYARSLEVQLRHRVKDEYPSIEEYISLRRDTSAVRVGDLICGKGVVVEVFSRISCRSIMPFLSTLSESTCLKKLYYILLSNKYPLLPTISSLGRMWVRLRELFPCQVTSPSKLEE